MVRHNKAKLPQIHSALNSIGHVNLGGFSYAESIPGIIFAQETFLGLKMSIDVMQM